MIPIGVFLIKFFTVTGQEYYGEDAEEDTKEGSPHRNMVDDGFIASSVVHYFWSQLKIEGNRIGVSYIDAINYRDLFCD